MGKSKVVTLRAMEWKESEENWLKLVVMLARRIAVTSLEDPQPGDLVVETTKFTKDPDEDPDAIGWLEGHDWAPYDRACLHCRTELTAEHIERQDDDYFCSYCLAQLDGREVWDIKPLNPHAKLNSHAKLNDGLDYQRWENATFKKLPDHIAIALKAL